MAIYYNILYPPLLPITYPAFELQQPNDTFRVYFEPSIGNKISDFKGGFIRIRNAETEKNLTMSIEGLFLDDYIPFRNPYAEYIDLNNPNKNISQPKGYNADMPFVEKDSKDNYYIDLKHDIFLEYEAEKDIRYKIQMMLTTDWISSTASGGMGHIQTWDVVSNAYVNIDKVNYFGGNLVAKGLSEWSTNSLLSPVREAKYELQIDGNSVFSPIFEFVGSSIEDNIRNNSMSNYLKAYRINIWKAIGDTKDYLVDSSDWIIGQEASNLEIRWQNVVELENKSDYIVELDIQTLWDLRKTFSYHISTTFESSLFQGNVAVFNDHDNARTKIRLNIKTPLQWGPKENIQISEDNKDYVDIDGEVGILEGIDLFNKDGSFGGEMIVSGIDPIRSWENKDDRWFLRLKGPELSLINPIQEEYLLYAYSAPLGHTPIGDSPYEDDLIINPVVEGPGKKVYATYLDSSKLPTLPDFDYSDQPGAVVTMETNLPPSHTSFYIKDEQDMLWRIGLTSNGELTTFKSHKWNGIEEYKPIAFHDPYNQQLVIPSVTEDGEIRFRESYQNYKLGERVQPMYINEFRMVKNIYALELGRKTKIYTQTYKAYMTNYNRKLDKWNKITKLNKYYMYFSTEAGQLRLIIRELYVDQIHVNDLDRFTSSYSATASIARSQSQLFLITSGMKPDLKTEYIGEWDDDRNNRRETPYAIGIDERGVLVADKGFISVASTSSRDIKISEVQDFIDRGEIEE